MSKIFSKDDKVKLELSTEEFLAYHKTAKVISSEAISDVFSKIRDSFSNVRDLLFKGDKEKALIDATGDKYETLKVLKRVKMVNIAKEIIVTPERFKGYYLDYLRDLTLVTEEMVPETIKQVENVKLAIASFLNEYKDNGVLSIYGLSFARETDKKREKTLKLMSSYFPHKKAVSKALIKDVIRSNADVPPLIDELPRLGEAIHQERLNKLSKLSKEISELVDILIEQNAKSGIMNNNTNAKKDLIEIIHIGASCTELCGYLYANTLQLYTAVSNLNKKIIEVGNR